MSQPSERIPTGSDFGPWPGFDSDGMPAGKVSFDDTNWFVVRRAGAADLPQFHGARATLCQVYWRPIYFYIRRLGYAHEDAQDLTQEFFCRLLRNNTLQLANQAKGKFRSYLLVVLKRFLADEWDRSQCQKRGGGAAVISLQEGDTAFRQRHEPVDDQTPERLLDRLWAESLLDQAMARLQAEMAAEGKETLFTDVKSLLLGQSQVGYAAKAARLGVSRNNLKVTVHRLRQRLRGILRSQIALTAASPEETDREIRELFAALG